MKVVALLLALAALPALAQNVSPTDPRPVSYPVSTVRNVSTIGAGTVNPANVGRYAFATATGGLVVADATTGLPLPNGRNLPVTVSTNIPKATVAGAIGRFAVKSLPLLSAGVALYDLGEELGFGLDNSGGTLEVTKPEDRDPSMDDPYENRGHTSAPWTHSGRTACMDYLNAAGIPAQYNIGTITFTAPGTCIANIQQKVPAGQPYGNFGFTVPYRNRLTDPPPPVDAPSSVAELEQAINDKASWSPSSPLARAFRDSILAGEQISRAPDSVTGPASTPGPVTTTNDGTNTTTSTTTHNHTYAGNQVTTTSTTTNVTVNNTTGAVISTTTVNNQPDMPEKDDEDTSTASDTPLPAITKLYEPEFPDGLEGVWNDRKAQLLDTSLFQLIPSLMPNVGDGGCPTWTIPSIYGGTLNASVPCYVWYFIRLVIILTALLLARRLIFGG